MPVPVCSQSCAGLLEEEEDGASALWPRIHGLPPRVEAVKVMTRLVFTGTRPACSGAGCLPVVCPGDGSFITRWPRPLVHLGNYCVHKQFALIIRFWMQHRDVLCI